MKKQTALLLLLVLCVALGMVAASSHGLGGALAVKQADAAFRDGAYQAKIDVASGRKAHFSSGRWSTDQDRASFIAGYEEAFRRLSGKLAEPTPAELAGYRDGVVDGARHRLAALPFQLNKTENYRRAGGYAQADTNLANYRGAYSNGYQEGYYLPQESAELRTISQN